MATQSAGQNLIRLDTGNCYQRDTNGIGLGEEDLARAHAPLLDAHRILKTKTQNGLEAEFACLNLAEAMQSQLPAIQEMAQALRQYPEILLIGIGGSSLGSKAVRHALKPDKLPGAPSQLRFIENIDPYQLDDLLGRLDPRTTAVLCISKSGGTIETVVQYLILRQWLTQALGQEQARRQQWLITDPTKGWLRELAQREHLPSLPVPPKVGGRYSVLTAVGLLPLAIAGVDLAQLLRGAQANAARCQSDNVLENPALEAAAIYYLLDVRQQKRISIMMPYVNRLRLFVDWYCQLWAESLGKPGHKESTEPAGSLPVRAMGAVDQHSQLQMYLESRQDKMFTFITLDHWQHDLPIPLSEEDARHFPYLRDKQLSNVIDAEFLATREVITQAGHPNLTIHLANLDAHTMGQLIDFYQRVTIYTGLLYGVNPLDQPAVERGKILAQEQLGRQNN